MLLREVLEPWCAAGVSGVLRVPFPPGGAVYVHDGKLEYAECPLAGGVKRLLTRPGRLKLGTWRQAVAAGRETSQVGQQLVDTGHLTRFELEATVLTAVFDAAFFLFDLTETRGFEPGTRSYLGHSHALDVAVVGHEVDRRKRLLADAWPDPAVDTMAVRPCKRLNGHSVALTALQWEILSHSDSQRTAVDLARVLGRDTYSVLLEVRRMIRAGLVEPGAPGTSSANRAFAVWRRREPVSSPKQERGTPAAKPVSPEPAPPGVRIPLPRRESSRNGVAAQGPVTPPVSEEVLTRLLAGLGAW